MLQTNLKTSFIYLSLVFIAILCVNCTSQVKSSQPEQLRALALTTTFPIYMGLDNTDPMKGDIVLIEKDELFIFKMPVMNFSSGPNIDTSGKVIGRTSTTDTSFYYIIFKQGDTTALRYDSLVSTKGTAISVDSFLASSTILALDKFLAAKTNDSLIHSTWIENNNVLVERYLPKSKPDKTYSDSTILRYDKTLNDFRFSFSKKIDSSKGSKLKLVKMIYNPDLSSDTPFYRTAREISFQLNKVPVEDPEAILALIKQYRKEIAEHK